MADQSVSDVLAVRGYKGDSTAGGSQTFGIKLDATPFDKLAQFTYFQNKDLWERKNKQDDADALELAKMAALDIASTDPETLKYFDEFKTNLLDTAKSGGLNYDNKDKFVEMHKLYGKFTAERTRASANDVIKLQWDNLINTTEGPEKDDIIAERDLAMKKYNEKGARFALENKLALPGYNPISQTSLSLPTYDDAFTFQTDIVGGNDNLKTTVKLNNPNGVFSAVDTDWLKYKGDVFKPTKEAEANPEVMKVEKLRFDKKNKAFKTVEDTTEKYNSYLQPYQADLAAAGTDKTKFDAVIQKMKTEQGTGISMVTDILESNRIYNENVDAANKLQDQQAAVGGIKPQPIRKLSIADGMTPEEYLTGKTVYGKALIEEQKKDLAHTGDETQMAVAKMSNALGWAKLALDKDEFKQKQQAFKASQVGSQTQINGAMERAKRIYKNLEELADVNGVITPDKIRKLNVEQLKYLGVEVPETIDENGKTIKGGFKPLSLSTIDDKNKFAIQLKDGNIQVMGGAKPIKDGRYTGEFDNTKSTNLFNMATNILNEELKTAGSKELNSYWGVDVTGGNTSFTQTTGSAISSGSNSNSALQSRKGRDGKTYQSTDGKTWAASDGTTVIVK